MTTREVMITVRVKFGVLLVGFSPPDFRNLWGYLELKAPLPRQVAHHDWVKLSN